MIVFDFIGVAAVSAGGGYLAVIGAAETARKIRQMVRGEVASIVAESAPSNSAAAAILNSMRDEPGEWNRLRHTFRHERSGTEIWNSNGWRYVSVWRTATSEKEADIFSDAEKRAIHRAMKRISTERTSANTRALNSEIISAFSKSHSGNGDAP